MNRRQVRASAVAALALLVAGCAGPQAHVSIVGKSEPLSVAFGKPVALIGKVDPPLAPVPAGVGVLPVSSTGGTKVVYLDDPTAKPVVPPPPACPTADPLSAPAEVAQNTITTKVPNGTFRYRYSGVAVQGRKAMSFDGVGTHKVSGSDVGNGVYRFTDEVAMLGATTTWSYSVVPAIGTAADIHGGTELTSVSGTGGYGYTAFFRPDEPIQVFSQPANAGTTWSDVGTDARTASYATINGTVDGKGRVDACGTKLDAWKTTSVITMSSPNENLKAVVQTWWGTQFGGLPIMETQSYSGTAGGVPVKGTVTSIINVDPATAKAKS